MNSLSDISNFGKDLDQDFLSNIEKRTQYMKNQEKINILSRKLNSVKNLQNNSGTISEKLIDQELKRQKNSLENLVKEFKIEMSKTGSTINIIA